MTEAKVRKIFKDLEEFSGYDLEIKTVYKNGIETTQLQIDVPGAYKPCLSIVEFDEDDVTGLTEAIVNAAKSIPEIDVDQLANKEFIMDHVFMAAENIKNEDALKSMNVEYDVHDVGLIAVYYCRISPEATFKIPKGKFDHGELKSYALANMIFDYKVTSMFNILTEMTGSEPDEALKDENSMVIITNKEMVYGAGLIFCENALEEARRLTNSDVIYILPSSIHELIAVSVKDAGDVKKLYEMVKTVNNSQVDPKDRLSYNVYKWDGEDLKIA